ncbi:response regulator transcription factor [Vineibacter terrae]|uniref:response regulator transcription factor n=1 Tax=Vineibacter terrae TaxID=2586908 RepID=UPI002E301B48|nr:response regulator [Vineibacter terrae]HEX2885628.1 response regulator [Vineibacter terrae]
MTQSATRVAVVDDDTSVCRALARLLRAHGLAVETYGSARSFLDSLGRSVPTCVVMDLQMPEMTGLELQQQLSAGGFRIPVIVITAHDAADTRQRCLTQGAAAYLVKPLREETLLQSITAATGR